MFRFFATGYIYPGEIKIWKRNMLMSNDNILKFQRPHSFVPYCCHRLLTYLLLTYLIWFKLGIKNRWTLQNMTQQCITYTLKMMSSKI